MQNLTSTMIAGSLLATALGFMFVREIAHSAMHIEVPESPSYALEIEESGGKAAEDIPLPFPQESWIAAMDPVRGEKIFKKCTSCHNAEQGGANGTGPNLWNIVGHVSAKHADFNYSAAMKNSGLTWDYAALNDFLTKPTSYLKGTNMSFIGLKKENDRAAVIAYLHQQADSPIPMPVAAAVPVSEGAGLEAGLDTDMEQSVPASEIVPASELTTATDNMTGAESTVSSETGAAVDHTTDAAKDITKDMDEAIDSAVDTAKEKIGTDH